VLTPHPPGAPSSVRPVHPPGNGAPAPPSPPPPKHHPPPPSADPLLASTASAPARRPCHPLYTRRPPPAGLNRAGNSGHLPQRRPLAAASSSEVPSRPQSARTLLQPLRHAQHACTIPHPPPCADRPPPLHPSYGQSPRPTKAAASSSAAAASHPVNSPPPPPPHTPPSSPIARRVRSTRPVDTHQRTHSARVHTNARHEPSHDTNNKSAARTLTYTYTSYVQPIRKRPRHALLATHCSPRTHTHTSPPP